MSRPLLKAYRVDDPAPGSDIVILVFATAHSLARWKAARSGVFGAPWEVSAWDVVRHLRALRRPDWDAYAEAASSDVVLCNADLPEGALPFYTDDDV